MKQKILLTLFVSVLALCSWANGVKINGIYYLLDNTRKTAEVTYTASGANCNPSSTAYTGSINIPESVTHDGITYSVTSIGASAFYKCTGLTSINIPNSVTEIEMEAFVGCTGLTSVSIPNSVTTIGEYAFADCTGLTSVTIPNSVTEIGNYAFYNCTGLTSVTIGNSVTSIGKGAFEYCTGLTSVTIPNSVTSIGKGAFEYCTGLTSVTIPNSVTSIGEDAFYCCTGLTSVTIPYFTSIGKCAFYCCRGLTSVTIPEYVTSIGINAFYGCSGLTSVTLKSNEIVAKTYDKHNNFSTIFGEQVREYILNNPYKIGDYAFADCTNMTGITLPESVAAIGKSAFYNCSSLNSITIPRLAGYIEKATFDGCSRLTKVTINSNEVCSSARYSENSSLQHVFPYATQYILGEEVEEISRYAFAGSRIQSLTVLNPMVTIDGDAFKDCDNLHNVYTNRGGTTLLGLWRSGFNTYDIKTYEQIKCPELSFQLTQTTATASVSNYYDEYKYSAYFDKSPYDYYYEEDRPEAVEIADQRYKMTGLKPGKEYDYWLEIRQGDDECMVEGVYKPIDISPSVEVIKNTPTSLYLQGSYTKGDAVFKDHRITFGRWSDAETKNGSTIIKEKLEPNTSYRVKYEVDILWGENNEKQDTYIWEGDIRTDYVWFNVLAPKVISVGNVIVASTVNIEDEDAVVGFEWRRMDWPDDIASSTGGAVLYEGMMEGYIRNMNADKLWTVRPYFISNYGNYYYGDWTGFDPSNTSYFEPTVHTYAKVTVQGNKATFKGYAMRGTDNVTEQGFKYWRVSDNVRGYEGVGVKATNIPANAQMVTASGQVMTATISNLDYSTDYCCVAFVTTSEGETFYGEQQAFRTGEDPTGISDVIISEDPEERTIVGYYNLQGQRMAEPQRGVNIIRYSDGTAKKVLLK